MDNPNKISTILIIDDEQVVLDVATLMVKKLGYKVLQAKSGKEAIQVFSDNVDVICLAILGMKLPDESGSDICKNLKSINPTVGILHTSGLGLTQSSVSLECGCIGFLPKPFRIEELSNKLKELLDT